MSPSLQLSGTANQDLNVGAIIALAPRLQPVADLLNKGLPADKALKARFAQKVGASGGSSDPSAISHVYHARQLADFVQATEKGRPPAVDGREGRRAVELILAIYRSGRTGQTVALEA